MLSMTTHTEKQNGPTAGTLPVQQLRKQFYLRNLSCDQRSHCDIKHGGNEELCTVIES